MDNSLISDPHLHFFSDPTDSRERLSEDQLAGGEATDPGRAADIAMTKIRRAGQFALLRVGDVANGTRKFVASGAPWPALQAVGHSVTATGEAMIGNIPKAVSEGGKALTSVGEAGGKVATYHAVQTAKVA